MMLAASLAGIGFGSAGVHIPHACAYPIAALKHEYTPPGYPDDHPFVPHGQSVIVTAPAAFRFTYEADPGAPSPGRPSCSRAASPRRRRTRHAPDVLTELMRDVGAPSGVPSSATTTPTSPRSSRARCKQQRLLVVSPREPSAEDIAAIIRGSMENWAPATTSAGSPASER